MHFSLMFTFYEIILSPYPIGLVYISGRPHLIDWKVSKKPKPTIQSMYDYPLQLAAYLGAVNFADNTRSTINSRVNHNFIG